MMPCIRPSLPSKVMPSGGVSGLPLLSNTAIDLPPYVPNQALSLASIAAPKVPPCMPPPAKPVVSGERGFPLGPNLVAFPCHSLSCPCQPIVKLSPTQRLPSLSSADRPAFARDRPCSRAFSCSAPWAATRTKGSYLQAQICCRGGLPHARETKSPCCQAAV